MNPKAVQFFKAFDDRKLGLRKKKCSEKNLEAAAEDLLVQKEYKEMKCSMADVARSTFLMVFSPDGTKVASTHGNHNIYVTDIRTGKTIKTLIGHPRTPWCIAFHPTSNQIVASGCLGGQVRIWDLSGGSEVWTTSIQSVIASIAFHPNDRILVIATYNEVYFWDWSKPEPFIHTATNNPKEKVRYVAFDKLGHRLITGISNSPLTRWERVRAPVPVPKQAETSASPYRRRITPRITRLHPGPSGSSDSFRPLLSDVADRERRISASYRNLVREYENLVHRYLQVYRPPAMVDRGTDPMEPNQPSPGPAVPSEQEPGPSHAPNTSPSTSSANNVQPSTSTTPPVIVPSELCSLISKPQTLIRGTQTTETTDNTVTLHTFDQRENGIIPNPRRLILKVTNTNAQPSTSGTGNNGKKMRIKCSPRKTQSGATEVPNLKSFGKKLLELRALQLKLSKKLTSENSASQNAGGSPSSVHSRIRSLGETLQGMERLQSRFSAHIEEEPQPSTSGLQNTKRRSRELYLVGPSILGDPRLAIDKLLNRNRWKKVKRLQKKRSWNACGTSSESSSSESNGSNSSSSDDDASSTRANFEFAMHSNKQSKSDDSQPSSSGVNKKPEQPNTSINNDVQFKSFEEKLSELQSFHSKLTENFTPLAQRANANREAGNVSSDEMDDNENSTVSLHKRLKTVGMKLRNLKWLHSQLASKVNGEPQPSTSRESNVAQNIEAIVHRDSDDQLPSPVRKLIDSLPESERPSLRSYYKQRCQKSKGKRTHSEMDKKGRTNSSEGSSSEEDGPAKRAASARNRTKSESGATSNSSTQVNLPSEGTANTADSTSSNPQPPRTAYGVFVSNDPSDNSEARVGPSVSSNPDGRCARTSTQYSTRYRNLDSEQPRPSRSMSAFSPMGPRLLRPGTGLPPLRRNLSRVSARIGTSFAQDEVINYSERVGSNEELAENPSSLNTLPNINPENIGIGNMYLNIVQDLESSLNDVRNIRASNRPGETSDMLSSFSERLENIMTQSDAILHNLRSSMEMLTPAALPGSPRESPVESDRELPTDDNFYVRERSGDAFSPEPGPSVVVDLNDSPTHVRLRRRLYPRSRNDSGNNMTPLMTSLHLTISHIQRQASLLRQQVESIERIDRAMLEVAQVQIIRQLFVDMCRHLSNLSGSDSRTEGVSSVRHMMAGTRISDPGPSDERGGGVSSPQNTSSEPEPGPSTSRGDQSRVRPARTRSARKTYPPSRFFRMQRQGRRPHLANFFSKRYLPRNARMMRFQLYKPYGGRPVGRVPETSTSPLLSIRRGLDLDSLGTMTRKLEYLLMEQMRYVSMGEPTGELYSNLRPPRTLEQVIQLTLTTSRMRMNRVLGLSSSQVVDNNGQLISVSEGESRCGARHNLTVVSHSLSRYFEENLNNTIPSTFQNQIQHVLGLSLLISEILLLRIVDSIPPPAGMNLDPERENLTARIDQMCTQMLQSRLTGHNQQLMRSLRLMRVTVRHGSRSPRRSDRDPFDRQEIEHAVMRNIEEEELPLARAITEANARSEQNPVVNLFSRLSQAENSIERQSDNSNLNAVTGEPLHRPDPLGVQNLGNTTSDDNDEPDTNYTRYFNDSQSSRPLYRTSNVNLLSNDPLSPTPPPRPWNVPTVQVNDVPISESNSMFQPRFWTRYRFPEYLSDVRNSSMPGLFRPRFLHPLYAGVNPFDTDLDNPQREQPYESDMITTVTPNHRIQVWDISAGVIPVISNPLQNVVVNECKIHNDASVDIASDGTILVTLLPSGGYLNVTNRLGVYSLRWESLGQCLYMTSFEQNAVSVSLSPLSRYLVVGLASRRVSIVPSDRWTMARIFHLDGPLSVLRELEQNRDTRGMNYKSVNCIRWLPISGQGLIYATNTGQLIVLT